MRRFQSEHQSGAAHCAVPLPRIEDIFSFLAGGEKFSKIDLSQAYLQMEVKESRRKFLTINTHKGLYQYNRLVFGDGSGTSGYT